MAKRSSSDDVAPRAGRQSLGYHVRQLSESWSGALHVRLSAQGIGTAAWRYLRELFDQDGLSNTELSKRVGRRGPTTVAALRSLELAGFINILPHPEDNRARTVHLTERGRASWQRAAPLVRETEAEALRDIGDDELMVFKKVVLRIQRNLDAAGHRRGPVQLRRTEELAQENEPG